MGDDLFGTDNILRDIDDGLGAGKSTAARPERAWLLRHTIQAINAHALVHNNRQIMIVHFIQTVMLQRR